MVAAELEEVVTADCTSDDVVVENCAAVVVLNCNTADGVGVVLNCVRTVAVGVGAIGKFVVVIGTKTHKNALELNAEPGGQVNALLPAGQRAFNGHGAQLSVPTFALNVFVGHFAHFLPSKLSCVPFRQVNVLSPLHTANGGQPAPG